mmetsp:Transcript_6386/g.9305  ORF Transcript_6386/g.9305 Transcript_6386/m.9305 type:complete len:236 (-) Transcript_6386:35-742(-)
MKRIVNPGIKHASRRITQQWKHQNYVMKPEIYWTKQEQLSTWNRMEQLTMTIKPTEEIRREYIKSNKTKNNNIINNKKKLLNQQQQEQLQTVTKRQYHQTNVIKEGETTIQSKNIYMNMIDTTYEVIVDELEKQFEVIDQDDYYFEDDATAIMIHCGEDRLFVLSRQLPARQLWYSSPLSGPWHYNLVETEDGHAYYWKCTRGDIDLMDRFQQEINACIEDKGVEIQLPYNINSQ